MNLVSHTLPNYTGAENDIYNLTYGYRFFNVNAVKNGHTDIFLHYIYMYMYIYICVFVCVRERERDQY